MRWMVSPRATICGWMPPLGTRIVRTAVGVALSNCWLVAKIARTSASIAIHVFMCRAVIIGSRMSDEPRPLQRYKLILAYRGTRYHGWQRQVVTKYYKGPVLEDGRHIPTVQELVTKALVSVLRHPILLVGSSRTDAGVHAKGQLAHFDSDQTQIPVEGMRRAVNHALSEDIVVREIAPVAETF